MKAWIKLECFLKKQAILRTWSPMRYVVTEKRGKVASDVENEPKLARVTSPRPLLMLRGHCVRVGYEVVALLFEKFFVCCRHSRG